MIPSGQVNVGYTDDVETTLTTFMDYLLVLMNPVVRTCVFVSLGLFLVICFSC